jgi:hypothetical protein
MCLFLCFQVKQLHSDPDADQFLLERLDEVAVNFMPFLQYKEKQFKINK